MGHPHPHPLGQTGQVPAGTWPCNGEYTEQVVAAIAEAARRARLQPARQARLQPACRARLERCRDKYTPVEVRRDFTELRAEEITGWLGAAPDPNRTVQRNARPPREWGFNLCVIFPGRIMQGPRDRGTAVKQTGWHSIISQGSHGAPTPWGLNRVETGQHHKASLGPALPRGHTA
ncbi:hypothetical protein PCANC_06892 [Puccinia coronata f. sp. avenae]|uniref:Uncharacterized protein n=1 Tax=Puccinia coronata f. sp. avenae TaxID=200324 RepID=A0A2N5VGU6_9BASI|nr:hypothetical protein PCASD_05198 [Puccinia coronata f. sp. avenae]PLW49223.1 hypothetical protein PCANC_06892 [Puccinia coronata f. sp. avenae]PLW51546.1 hypothetical protein PCASD_00330 [Puccinia coronata f. sp. avenae]